jgi:hypothetical protein
MLLQARDVQGDRVGLYRALAELRILAGHEGPGGPFHPETMSLFDRLLQRVPAARGCPASL